MQRIYICRILILKPSGWGLMRGKCYKDGSWRTEVYGHPLASTDISPILPTIVMRPVRWRILSQRPLFASAKAQAPTPNVLFVNSCPDSSEKPNSPKQCVRAWVYEPASFPIHPTQVCVQVFMTLCVFQHTQQRCVCMLTWLYEFLPSSHPNQFPFRRAGCWPPIEKVFSSSIHRMVVTW